jgi:hypothetical protein
MKLLIVQLPPRHITIMTSSSEDISQYKKKEIINRSLQCAGVKCDWFHTADCIRSVSCAWLHQFESSLNCRMHFRVLFASAGQTAFCVLFVVLFVTENSRPYYGSSHMY